MPDGQPRQPRRAAPQTKRRGQQTTANAPPLPAAGQNDGSKAAESWQLYTVWARWSAASVRMWSLLQQLVRDRAVQVPVIGLDVDQNPDEVRKLGITLVPSLVLMHDGREASRLTGEVGAVAVTSWMQAAMETV